ncbi:MAG: hypothetical protein IK089_01765 [Oxalobacter sp.]|nr:hypothetical protein [Oxalobacter sp.]MBR5999966.1 hypothetical protein [Oxalobacter sp.]
MVDPKNMTESELVKKLLDLCGERDVLAEKLALLNREEEALRREYNEDWNMWYHTKEGLKLFHKKWDKGSRGYHAKEGELLKRIREMSSAVAKIDKSMCTAIREYRNAKYPAMEVVEPAKAVEDVSKPSKKDGKESKKDQKKS